MRNYDPCLPPGVIVIVRKPLANWEAMTEQIGGWGGRVPSFEQ